MAWCLNDSMHKQPSPVRFCVGVTDHYDKKRPGITVSIDVRRSKRCSSATKKRRLSGDRNEWPPASFDLSVTDSDEKDHCVSEAQDYELFTKCRL